VNATGARFIPLWVKQKRCVDALYLFISCNLQSNNLLNPYLQSLLTEALALLFDSLAAFFANGFSDFTWQNYHHHKPLHYILLYCFLYCFRHNIQAAFHFMDCRDVNKKSLQNPRPQGEQLGLHYQGQDLGEASQLKAAYASQMSKPGWRLCILKNFSRTSTDSMFHHSLQRRCGIVGL